MTLKPYTRRFRWRRERKQPRPKLRQSNARRAGRTSLIEEDSVISVAAEEVDIESEEDLHEATDGTPRELYEI
jgi:hypothetical protein